MTDCVITHEGRSRRRRGWESAYGPIPEGRELHHTCDEPRCSNLEHLVPMTRAEHMALDGRSGPDSPGARARRAITHCAQGHEFTEENTGRQWSKDHWQRYCRTCRRAYSAKWYQRKKEEVVPL